jgi:hypothetical protein
MKVKEFFETIDYENKDTFKLDLNGHFIGCENYPKKVLLPSMYLELLAMSLAKDDALKIQTCLECGVQPYYAEIPEKRLTRPICNAINYLNFRLKEADDFETVEISDGKSFPYFMMDHVTCPNCGLRLEPSVNKDGIDKKSPCKYKDGIPSIVTEIELPTGELRVCNFFEKEELESAYLNDYYENSDEEFDYEEKSINNYEGRVNLAKFYETLNIVYAQTTNCYLYFYLNKEKNHMITTLCELKDFPDSFENCEELLKRFENYDFVGEICCDMWRWMGADKNTVENLNLECSDNSFDISLEKGKWRLTNKIEENDGSKEDLYDTMIITEFELI